MINDEVAGNKRFADINESRVNSQTLVEVIIRLVILEIILKTMILGYKDN